MNPLKNKIVRLCCFLIFTIIIGQSSVSATSINEMELSLASAILFALDNNPDIEIAQSKEEQSKYDIDSAKSGYYPDIQFSAKWGREYNNPSSGEDGQSKSVNSSDMGLVVNQLVFDGFQTTQKIKANETLHESTQLQTEIKTEEIIKDTVKYYLEILRLQNNLQVMESYFENIEKIVKTVSEMYKAGAASKASKDYAMAQLASARSAIADTKSSYNDAVNNLEYLTGKLPQFSAQAPEMFNPEHIDLSYYLERAKEYNNNMLLNASDKTAVKHQMTSERGDYYPEISLQMDAGQSENSGGEIGRDRDLSMMVQLNYNIFDGFSRESKINKLKSKYNELEIKDRKIIKELNKTIKLAYNQITLLQENLKATSLEIDANESVKQLNEENFKHGNVNIIDLLEVEEKLKNSKLREHKLQSELFMNVYKLIITTGIMNKYYFCETCRDNER